MAANAAVCLSNLENSIEKVKVEGIPGTLRKKKVGYAAPVFAEPPSLFPFSLCRGYTRKEFAEKYGLHHSGMSPKQLRESDVTDAELVTFFGPIVNKNGHRYMFLRDKDLIQRIEHMWMVCHQKSIVLQSRLITKAMAKGFYIQEVKKKKPNWALYAEWTNNEQLRRRLKSKSRAELNGEDYVLSDGEDDGEFEEGGSTQSKVTAHEAGSRHGGVVRDHQGIEVFTAPGGLPETISCWKTYSGIAHAQVVEATRILEDAKIGRDEHMQIHLKARSQVEFCDMKLRSTRKKCADLEASLDSLHRRADGDSVQVGEDLACTCDALRTLSRNIEAQKSLVQAFQDCLDEANVEFLKVTGGEGVMGSLVSDAELRLMQANRHELAVKLLIDRLDIGTYLFQSVPPRPYSQVIICDPLVQHALNKCVACGLGFAPVWAVKLASCCHPYHEWCSRIHFESSKFCIAPDCGVEMHKGWWVSTGLLKPGVAVPPKSTVERFSEEQELGSIRQGQLSVWLEVCPTIESGHPIRTRANASNVVGPIAGTPCKPGLPPLESPIVGVIELTSKHESTELVLNRKDGSLGLVHQAEVSIVSGVEENGGSGLVDAMAASITREEASEDIEEQLGENLALKGLKSKSLGTGKKPCFATKFCPKVLPMSAILGNESTEEEGGEEEDGEEDEGSMDEEDEAETTECASKDRKLKKRTPPKRKAPKSRNSKHKHVKKMKVPITERISTTTNTRTAKKKS